MSKIPILKPKEVIQALKRAGFIETRSKGSHLQLKKGIIRVTIPMHNTDIRPKTMKSILWQARMTSEELIELI